MRWTTTVQTRVWERGRRVGQARRRLTTPPVKSQISSSRGIALESESHRGHRLHDDLATAAWRERADERRERDRDRDIAHSHLRASSSRLESETAKTSTSPPDSWIPMPSPRVVELSRMGTEWRHFHRLVTHDNLVDLQATPELVEAAERALARLDDFKVTREIEQVRWLPLQAFLILGRFDDATKDMVDYWTSHADDDAALKRMAVPFLEQTLAAQAKGVHAFRTFFADAICESRYDEGRLVMTRHHLSTLLGQNVRLMPDYLDWIKGEASSRGKEWTQTALQMALLASETRRAILDGLSALKSEDAADRWAYRVAAQALYRTGHASEAYTVAQEALAKGIPNSGSFGKLLDRIKKRLGLAVQDGASVDDAADGNNLTLALERFDKLEEPSAKDWQSVLDLYASRADLEGALAWKEKLEWYRASWISHDTYAALLKACAGSGNIARVKDILHDMERRGISLSPRSLPILMGMFGFSKNITGTEAVWKLMTEKNEGPTALDYSGYLSALYNCRQFEKVLTVFASIPEHSLSVSHYNQLIMTHVNLESPRHVIDEILRDMASKGIEKSGFTYNVLMKYAASRDDIEDAHRLFDELNHHPSEALHPTVQHYNILLSLYIRTSQWSRARALFDEMSLRKIEPTVATKGLLLTAHTKSATRGDREAVQEMIAGMVRDAKAKSFLDTSGKGSDKADAPSARLFAMAAGGAVAGQLADLSTINSLFRDALRAGTRPNLEMWGVLINACCREGALAEGATAWIQAAELGRKKSQMINQVDYVGSVPVPKANAMQGRISLILNHVLRAYSKAGWHSFAKRAWDDVEDGQKAMSNYIIWLNSCLRAGSIEEAFDVVSSKAIVLDTWHLGQFRHAIQKMEQGLIPTFVGPSKAVRSQIETFRKNHPRYDRPRPPIPPGDVTLRRIEERYPDLLQRIATCREDVLTI